MPAWLKKTPPKTTRKYYERIGRLREKHRRVAQDYRIEAIADDEKNNAICIEWQWKLKSGQKHRHCGIYCLRIHIAEGSEQQLWATYRLSDN